MRSNIEIKIGVKMRQKMLEFPRVKKRRVFVGFNGGEVTSDAGFLLLKQADLQLRLISQVGNTFSDKRQKSKIKHEVVNMLRQRVYAMACGYEDLNDHSNLRKDTVLQTSVNENKSLASPSTLCRLEKTAKRKIALYINKILLETFIKSQKTAPKELILDFDPTDNIVHGKQEKAAYHGYYGSYCFLPLYVFCGTHLLVAYLRPSNQDPVKHSWAILSLIVKRLRQKWPNVKIIFRADSAFARPQIFNWCEKNNVYYITGIGKNSRLKEITKPFSEKTEELFDATKSNQCIFTEFCYAAKTWTKERKIICKSEQNEHSSNLRLIVTNLEGKPESLYRDVYCARGNMENRIKEQQLYLFADRTSSSFWWQNQLRMLISSLAYVLVNHIRINALKDTALEKAQVHKIRLCLFKIGAVVVKNSYKILILFSSYYPFKNLFEFVYQKLVPS